MYLLYEKIIDTEKYDFYFAKSHLDFPEMPYVQNNEGKTIQASKYIPFSINFTTTGQWHKLSFIVFNIFSFLWCKCPYSIHRHKDESSLTKYNSKSHFIFITL